MPKLLKTYPFTRDYLFAKVLPPNAKVAGACSTVARLRYALFHYKQNFLIFFLRKNEKFFILIKNGAIFKHHDLAHYFFQSFAKALDFLHRLEMTGAERIKVSFYVNETLYI